MPIDSWHYMNILYVCISVAAACNTSSAVRMQLNVCDSSTDWQLFVDVVGCCTVIYFTQAIADELSVFFILLRRLLSWQQSQKAITAIVMMLLGYLGGFIDHHNS